MFKSFRSRERFSSKGMSSRLPLLISPNMYAGESSWPTPPARIDPIIEGGQVLAAKVKPAQQIEMNFP